MEKKGTTMTDTNDPGRGGLEESTIDLIVDHDAPRLHAEAEAISGDAKPLIWVPDPANRHDHDAGNHRGLPIVPPSWAGNTTPGWANTINPETIEPATEPDRHTPGVRNHRKRRVAVAVVAIVVILAAILTGLAVWQTGRVREAVNTCEAANTRITDATGSLIELIAGDDYKDATSITAEQVEDPDTVTALQAAIDTVNEQVRIGGDEEPAAPVIACAIDWTDPQPGLTADEAARAAELLETRFAKLKDGVQAVVESRDEKTLNDAADALKAKTDQAGALLKDSEDKVQDDATRDALDKAIDEAEALLGEGDDAKAMNDAVALLDQAMNAVNDSIKAKQDADAQAAADAAAQQSQSYTPSYTGGYTGGGYYTPSYTGGGASSGGSIFDRLPSAIGGADNPDMQHGGTSMGQVCFGDGDCPVN